jgi:hypothetical protein
MMGLALKVKDIGGVYNGYNNTALYLVARLRLLVAVLSMATDDMYPPCSSNDQ